MGQFSRLTRKIMNTISWERLIPLSLHCLAQVCRRNTMLSFPLFYGSSVGKVYFCSQLPSDTWPGLQGAAPTKHGVLRSPGANSKRGLLPVLSSTALTNLPMASLWWLRRYQEKEGKCEGSSGKTVIFLPLYS